MERVATLRTNAQCSAVEIGEISADKSGRSFLIKIPDGEIFYFWCSEKSKLLGDELLRKMKDLLARKPSLAELTGINDSRFNCFASHLRVYLTGSMIASSSFLPATPYNSVESCESSSSESTLESQDTTQFGVYQATLGPAFSSFKDLASVGSIFGEKLSQCEEEINMSCVDNLDFSLPKFLDPISSNFFENDDLPKATRTKQFPALSFLDSVRNPVELPFLGLEAQIPSQLPFSMGDAVSLPPLSTLLAASRQSSCLTSNLPLNLDQVPPLDFPPLLPEQLIRLPLPLPVPTSQQIVTFSPLTCDPIVHVPVIEVCSSGQGYLVSAGPTMSTTIPSLGSDLVKPLLPDVESVVEKGARETLRLLISTSNQPNSQLLDVFPSVLTNGSHKPNLFAVSNGIAAVGMVPFTKKSAEIGIGKRCMKRDDWVDQLEKPSAGFGSSFPEDYCSDMRDEKMD